MTGEAFRVLWSCEDFGRGSRFCRLVLVCGVLGVGGVAAWRVCVYGSGKMVSAGF